MAVGCPKIRRCLLGPAARRLALAFKSHPPTPTPTPAPSGAPSLSPKSELLRKRFSLLAAPISFVRWPCGLLGVAGLGRIAPPPPILLQRGWGLLREVRRWLTHPPKPDSPPPAWKDLENWLRDLGVELATPAASAFWNSAPWPGV